MLALLIMKKSNLQILSNQKETLDLRVVVANLTSTMGHSYLSALVVHKELHLFGSMLDG